MLGLPGRIALTKAVDGVLSTFEFGEHLVSSFEAARQGNVPRAVSELVTDIGNGAAIYGGIRSLIAVSDTMSLGVAPAPSRSAVTPEGVRVQVPLDEVPSGVSLSEADRKRMNVGGAGHHVPSVRKARGRLFEVDRADKSRPTIHVVEGDQAEAHWRMHDAERQHVGPRQGDFQGTDQQLLDAYKRAYAGLDDIKVDVRSPDGQHILAHGVTPEVAVGVIESWLKQKGML